MRSTIEQTKYILQMKKNNEVKNRKRQIKMIKFTSTAACLALVVVAFIILPDLIDNKNYPIGVVNGSGEVANRNDFVITSYNINSTKVADYKPITTNLVFHYGTLESYEQSCLQGSATFSGQAAIIKCRKVGKSESFYRDGGFFINDAGNKEQDITAFTLTQIEVMDTFDGVKIRTDNNLIKKGDIITVLEIMWIEKDKSGNNILKIPYMSNRVPIKEDTVYILYLSKINEGYQYHSAILNDVWVSGQDMFILNNETRKIKTKDDVMNIKQNDSSKYYMNQDLYPLVIEKYGNR